MSELAASFERSAFGRRFRFRENRTTPGRDTIAGMTTFIVMSYIIFVNPASLGFPEAMGLVVIEGVAITILVVLGLREAIMRAIPIELKKAIAIGIGLFIAFIGLYNSGLVQGRQSPTPVDLTPFTNWTT